MSTDNDTMSQEGINFIFLGSIDGIKKVNLLSYER